MDIDLQKKLSDLIDKSQFVRSIRSLKQCRAKGQSLGEHPIRELTGEEINSLVAQGNSSRDWSEIRVSSGFITNFIRNNIFQGNCILGIFSGIEREIAPGIMIQDGIYGSTIVNGEIGDECLIKDCGVIAHYRIRENAVVFRVGSLTLEKGCTFGNGIEIPVGMETGGREILSCAEIDLAVAELIALQRHDKKLLEKYENFIKNYRENITGDFGIIEKSARIRNISEIKNSYIGEGALIDGASFIDNCTILCGPRERTEISHGAYVKNSCVQWGCKISSMAMVTDSLLTEFSGVERHGKVKACVLGPNTEIAEGEATSCLIGPFVSFHHQALLIAALWPEGKGNVAYGANVGSNHTSRAPDQEIFCGEGTFFGLGTNIKFPSDFSQAPYCIFATGINTLPQRIEFPFSLIQSQSRHFPDVFPSYNEIVPAWVLSNNVYMLLRNEKKYKNRNKSKRMQFDFTVFRPDIIEKMLKARNKLNAITTKKTVYSDKDIQGIGKNILRDEKRIQAIEAYSLYIEYYCLLGLRDRLIDIINIKNESLSSIYEEKTWDTQSWKHQKDLLMQEGFARRNTKENLIRLISILETINGNALSAKEKDDIRGSAIIPDYQEVHKTVSHDSFLKEISQETGDAIITIKQMISRL